MNSRASSASRGHERLASGGTATHSFMTRPRPASNGVPFPAATSWSTRSRGSFTTRFPPETIAKIFPFTFRADSPNLPPFPAIGGVTAESSANRRTRRANAASARFAAASPVMDTAPPFGQTLRRSRGSRLDERDDDEHRHEEADLRSRAGEGAERGRRQRERGRGYARLATIDAELKAEEDVADQERCDSAGENGRARPGKLVERALERCAFCGRDCDDPEQDRQVRVSVRIQRRARPPDGAHGAHRTLRQLRVADEVEPPEARAEGKPEHGREDERAVDGQVRGADADSDDGLADRDQH